jgi:hypothetical protein
MNSVWFNVEHYHNTHSTQYKCTHYTLLSTAWCFQSVCSSVTSWCVILFSTNSSPLVHPPVHFPPEPHQNQHPPQGLSREMRTVWADIWLCHVCFLHVAPCVRKVCRVNLFYLFRTLMLYPITKRLGRLVNTPVSYSEGPGFKFQTGDRLSWLRYFPVLSGKCRDSALN